MLEICLKRISKYAKPCHLQEFEKVAATVDIAEADAAKMADYKLAVDVGGSDGKSLKQVHTWGLGPYSQIIMSKFLF